MNVAPESPRVSVVLCTYDRAGLLARAVDSVLCQSFTELELIVVDDGSSDGTSELLAGFTDPRLRTLRLEKNVGQAAARNAGIRLAQAPLLAFQDSDDEWVPEKLEWQVPALEASGPETCLVYCDMVHVGRDGTASFPGAPRIERGRLVDAELGFYQVFGLGIQSVIVRRSCLDRVGGFDERFRCFDDLELFLRLSAVFDFTYLAEPLVRYHDTDGVSNDRHAELIARGVLLRRYATRLASEAPGFLVREAVRVARGRLGVALRGRSEGRS